MFKVRVTRSIAGFADFSAYELRADKITSAETTRKIPEKWLYALADDFEDLMRRYGHVTSQERITPNHSEKEFLQKGLIFTKLLFGNIEAAEELFSASKADPIVFSVDREYSGLPFEVISDGSSFLCDLRPVLRSIRSESAKLSKHSPWSKFRRSKLYLPIAANDKPEVLRSAINERALLMHVTHGRLKVQAPDAVQLRLSVLLENMLTTDFMHFAGHSSEYEIPLAGGEALVPQDIARLKLQNLEIVFLNGCKSAKQSHNEFQETFATAFIAAGVRHYIGYSLPVPNGASEIASLSFWKSIRAGEAPHAALFKARKALRNDQRFSPYRFLLQEFGNIDIAQNVRWRTKYAAMAVAACLVGVSAIFWWKTLGYNAEKLFDPQAVGKPKLIKSDHEPKPRRATQEETVQLPISTKADRQLRSLIDAFVPVSLKLDFLPEDLVLMDRIWSKLEKNTKQDHSVCSANLMNGNERHGRTPIGRRQIIRNLLVFQCVPEAPAHWDDYVQNKLKPERD